MVLVETGEPMICSTLVKAVLSPMRILRDLISRVGAGLTTSVIVAGLIIVHFNMFRAARYVLLCIAKPFYLDLFSSVPNL